MFGVKGIRSCAKLFHGAGRRLDASEISDGGRLSTAQIEVAPRATTSL